jgi:hypothetical protein
MYRSFTMLRSISSFQEGDCRGVIKAIAGWFREDDPVRELRAVLNESAAKQELASAQARD